jgi:tRNA pseudouridine55 synthase
MGIEKFQNAVLLFDKPLHWTSFDVVNKIRRVLKVKIGHAGTLDPLATGLLILNTGQERKNVSAFQGLEKEYTGTLRLGSVTASYDAETAVTQQFDTGHISDEMIFEATRSFLGEQLQLAPPHSAKQVAGKRYYEMAREGKPFERKPHLVSLNEFEITKIQMPEVVFRIVCGKGFYVRSLVHDFGKTLNSGAYLTALCRTRIGGHHLRDAWQISDFINFVKEQNAHEGPPPH